MISTRRNAALLLVLILGGTGAIGAGLARGDPPSDPLSQMKKHEEDRAAATQAEANDPQSVQQRRLGALQADAPVIDEAKCKELAATLNQEQVNAAVRRGSDYLLKRLEALTADHDLPDPDQAAWHAFAGDQRVGVVALMVEALLESGRMTGDPRLHPLSKELAPALSYLSNARSTQTYSTALQASALSLLPATPEFRKALGRVRNDLAAGMRGDGGYGYSLDDKTYWDNSNTQFAVLGMWGAADAGAEVPTRFWQIEDRHWRGTQSAGGGWGYRVVQSDFKMDPGVVRPAELPALTAAGVASLYVTTDQLAAKKPAGGDMALIAGLARMDQDVQSNLADMSQNLYYLYTVERVGVASGRKYLGNINWYRRIAAALILSQGREGSWIYGQDLVGTSLALLFLTHGGAPVIFNALEYGQPGDWDPEPRALAKLTLRMDRTLERRFNWQIVSLGGQPADWLDAPILLITGERDPRFTAADLDKLRAYVRAGGMIVSMGGGEDGPFTQAVKRYAAAIAGENSAMRKLPADHPLLTLPDKIKDGLELWGVSNGVRELWVHSPMDCGAAWESLAFHLSDQWQLPLNLMAYATGQERPRGKLESLTIPPPAANPAIPAAAFAVAVARVHYQGHWDPEPGAWPRFAAMLSRDAGVNIQLVGVPAEDLDAAKTPIAHITGTAAFAPTAAEKAGLLKFLQDGGVLIGDAAGGSRAFADSFEALAHTLTGQSIAGALSADAPAFAGSLPGSIKLGPMEYRKATPADRRGIEDHPAIWTWKFQGRDAILFSPLDLTAGLLGTETWGIAGYRPQVAQQVARDLVADAASIVAKK